jgi:hypothetical protein
MKGLFKPSLRYRNGMRDFDTDSCVIAAHPTWHKSRVNRRFVLAAQSMPRLQVQSLYSACTAYAVVKVVATLRQRLERYPNCPGRDDLAQCTACVAPIKAQLTWQKAN